MQSTPAKPYGDLSPRQKRQVDAVVLHELTDERMNGDERPLAREEMLAKIATRRDEIATDMQREEPLFYEYEKVLPGLMEAMHHAISGNAEQLRLTPADSRYLVLLMGLSAPGKNPPTGERSC